MIKKHRKFSYQRRDIILTEIPRPNTSTVAGISDSSYKMDHQRRGRVAILLHKQFSEGLEPREGAEEDVKRLREQLPRLGFQPDEISVYVDLTYSQINDTLKAREWINTFLIN